MAPQKNAPQTWFITGASSGFGLALAEAALAAGHNVVGTARRPEALAGLARKAGPSFLASTLDVDTPTGAETAVAAALSRFGRIDVLVNNAGYGSVGAVEETPEDELRAQMETNFFGAVRVIRAALPSMRTAGGGAIVNFSSLGGQLSMAGFSAYSASKFALEGLSEALAAEIAPFGIRVLIVEPGAFRTGFAAGALRHMPELAAYAETVGPMRGFAHGMDGTQAGDPDKAARAIIRALEAETPPLRLQLGDDAVDAVRAHAERLLRELAAWEDVARDTAFS